MCKIITSIFPGRRVPEIHGAFVGESGFVKGQVEIHGSLWPFDVTFQIDTASYWTVLLDYDFINSCKILGWTQFRDPDILNWIRTRPNLFQDDGCANTVGGTTNSIYRINSSRLLYYLPNGDILDNKWEHEHEPVYGAFSKGFSEGTSGAHISLLGIDRLNEFREFLWSWPKKTIRLTP